MRKTVLCLGGLFFQLLFLIHAQPYRPAGDRAAVSGQQHFKYTNIVKIAPLGFASGVYPIFYERILTSAFRVQGGIGLTGYNRVRGVLNTQGNDISVKYTSWPLSTSFYNDQAPGPLKRNPRKAQAGYLFTIQPRLYLPASGHSGIFAGLAYDHYRYRFSIPRISAAGSFTGPRQREHEQIRDFVVNAGYQQQYRRLALELSMGAGIRRVKGTKYVAYNQQEGMAAYTDQGAVFSIGLKTGYVF